MSAAACPDTNACASASWASSGQAFPPASDRRAATLAAKSPPDAQQPAGAAIELFSPSAGAAAIRMCEAHYVATLQAVEQARVAVLSRADDVERVLHLAEANLVSTMHSLEVARQVITRRIQGGPTSSVDADDGGEEVSSGWRPAEAHY